MMLDAAVKESCCNLSPQRIQICDMQIEWKSPDLFPYLSKQIVEWPGLRIVRAHVLPGRMAEHSNDFHEVNVAIAGSLTTQKHSATGKDVRTRGSGGNICVTPAGQSIAASWDKPLDNLMMSLDPEMVSRAAAENGISSNVEFVEIYQRKDPLLQSLGLSLLEHANAEAPGGRLYTESLIQTLTLHLLTNYTTVKSRISEAIGGLSGYRLRRVKDYIETHLEDDLSLTEIAAVAELSPFHFSRAFRRSTGKTPQQYLMQRRMERAKELLSFPDLPIVEVSLRAGFKNQSHFSALFRKYTNLTPKLWRELKIA